MDSKAMKRVIRIRGIFFKAADPQKLYAWYERDLGIKGQGDEGVSFPWRRVDDPSQETFTARSIIPGNTPYFSPRQASFMINYQVEDLDGLLEALPAEVVTIDPKREEYDYRALRLDHRSRR